MLNVKWYISAEESYYLCKTFLGEIDAFLLAVRPVLYRKRVLWRRGPRDGASG